MIRTRRLAIDPPALRLRPRPRSLIWAAREPDRAPPLDHQESDRSVGEFVTSIRTAGSLGLAWPGLTAPPVPAHPIGRSVEPPGSGTVPTPAGTHGTCGRPRCSGYNRRRRR